MNHVRENCERKAIPLPYRRLISLIKVQLIHSANWNFNPINLPADNVLPNASETAPSSDISTIQEVVTFFPPWKAVFQFAEFFVVPGMISMKHLMIKQILTSTGS